MGILEGRNYLKTNFKGNTLHHISHKVRGMDDTDLKD